MVMAPQPPSRWYICPRPRPGARLKLVVFPHAGGGIASYTQYFNKLSASIEVWVASLPGRERRIRDPIPETLAPLLSQLVCHLSEVGVGPFALFGHSMGALVAFEVSRSLRELGLPTPTALVASGSTAPRGWGDKEKLHLLSDPRLVQEVERLGGTPSEVLHHPELRELILPVLRADLTMGELHPYRPASRLPWPIYAYGGEVDPSVRPDELLGWQEETTAAFRRRVFPGGHFFLQEAAVLSALEEDLLGGA